MKKITIILAITIYLFNFIPVYAEPINDAETELNDTLVFALISSLRKPVDTAISEIYKDDEDAPSHLNWDAYDTELLHIKQVYGVGGLYEITLKVFPYYGPHNSYGIDEIVVNTSGEVVSYKHIKTYTKPY
ncbi:DUF3888 domain-containing protein [Ornithinibacillus salinisoli]|uniref:DUF3888 domain-containing protein n=1 Tax=Ornithinibacillus salinisoli TaxID=1848459 RepID=A0ABW4W3V1_9BACI